MAAISLALVGCALPRSGPTPGDFSRAAADRTIELVQPTMQDALLTHASVPVGFPAEWRELGPASIDRIGRGDVLGVTIFERDGLGLFPAGDNGGDAISNITVQPNGAIQLPYLGSISVAGLTPDEARRAIVRRLAILTVAPDVIVGIAERHSELLSVQGDVAKPGVVPLAPDSNRLLSLVGAAGPTPADLELATVTVRRGPQSATMRLADLYSRPDQNIALRGGDVVIVRSTPEYVNVLGAAGLQGRVRITRPDYSVLDAIGDSRGLNDQSANPRSVYLMEALEMRRAVPRVFHFDLRQPGQIAVAEAFIVHDGDALLISDAPFAQATKVLSAFSLVATTARSSTQIP